MKKVKEYMKKKVIHFKPTSSIFEVAKVLSKHNISGAPVVHKKKVVGVISVTDIIKFMKMKLPEQTDVVYEPHILSLLVLSMLKDQFQFRRELKRISKIQVKDVMSKDVISISSDANLLDAATLMEKHDVARVPVINDGKLVGVISKTDLIRSLIE